MQGSENNSANTSPFATGGSEGSEGVDLSQAQVAPEAAAAGGWPEADVAVNDELNKALAQAAEFKDLYLRAKADGENLRRRAQEDISKAHKYGIENFAESLLPVKDSLEAALNVQGASPEAMREGIEITLRQLTSAFEKNKLVEIDPAAGAKFDPHQHQAISMVPSEQDANTVVVTLQKGYMIAERVLRPALVTVSQGKV